ncbi:Lsr2 family protein [Aciditerrimonas ferrireducens]|uniref:Lsr2 family protein n=1 Tax=Aciditerrimonas ferrireducens TaxID=667306 RepID=A0ABV6C1Q1_9ACTN
MTQLTDDIDGSEAEETVVFGLDGKTYEIDLSKKNAAALRKALAVYVEHARPTGRGSRRRAPQGSRATSGRRSAKTLFSQLDAEEKERFRAWADMPTARRISDARVQEWIDAGRP